MKIHVKRIYDIYQRSDGFRILVDRLWPRGIKKEDANVDLWIKDIAPSASLRKWFNHDLKKWPEFQKRYAKELHEKTELLSTIREKAKENTVTLLFGAKETEHNNAVVLRNFLLKKL